MDGRNKHQFVCLYESKECPFRELSNADCSWTGTLSDIAAHIRSDYSSEAIQDVRHFQVKLLDISRQTRYRQAVLIFGELFYFIIIIIIIIIIITIIIIIIIIINCNWGFTWWQWLFYM